jgi:hypothetical protein
MDTMLRNVQKIAKKLSKANLLTIAREGEASSSAVSGRYCTVHV